MQSSHGVELAHFMLADCLRLHVNRYCVVPTSASAHFRGPLSGAKQARTKVGIRDITAKNFLIATGSVPREVPAYPADGHRIMTSDHIMRLRSAPTSIAIIGAGMDKCARLYMRVLVVAGEK